jgi:hypothetical protein
MRLSWHARWKTRAMVLIAVMGVFAPAGYAQTGSAPVQTQEPAPAKPLPEAPQIQKEEAGQSKKEGAPQGQNEEAPGPVQQVEEQTKKAAEMTEHELLRARDWEATWIAGPYAPRHHKLVPLSRKDREEIYLRQTFTTPETYMKRLFAAGIDQARGVPGQWDDGLTGYFERFASREGQFFTSNSLAALGNAKLGYEVRYDQCKCEGFWPRARHAIMRNFLTYGRDEQELRPQVALFGGAFVGGMVSTAWKPSPKNAWANGGWAVVGQAGYGTLLNFVIEFSREINRKQGVER